MADLPRMTQRQALETASRAVGRVLHGDVRGMTLLSIDEIAAMAWALTGFGLVPTQPGETPPEQLIFTNRKEAADGQ